ncbi:MAG: response regulator transcription factor [Sphingobacteriales bacterium]|nr:MAG: response regulator transcription factor [Sphingobacteriales bacterium]
MRFLIADDHSIVRMGVRLLLEDKFPLVKIDEAENGDSIVEKIKQHQYDLLILDFQMPNTDTFNIIGYLLARHEDAKILIYSMASEKLYAGKLLKAGVKGFLSKEANSAELLKAVDIVLDHGIYASELVKAHNLQDATEGVSGGNPFTALSEKEIGILNYLIQGKNTKEISTLSNLQMSTISTHKFRIFRKLSVNNMVELIDLAKEHKII